MSCTKSVRSKQAVSKGVAIARIKKMPKWARMLIESDLSYVPTFEALRDTYIYLRSIKELIDRADITIHGIITNVPIEVIKELDYVFTKEGFASILDVKKITHSLVKLGLGPDKTLSEKKRWLDPSLDLQGGASAQGSPVRGDGGPKGRGPKPPPELDPELEKRLANYLVNGGKQSRSLEWKWRLKIAVEEAVVSKKWYALFGTYTVDPMRLPMGCLTRDDLWKKTPAWDRFIKRFKTETADSLGYGRKPAKWPKTNTFFQYFAVLEHGKSLEHPHIHVIFLLKNIPQRWKIDPNINSKENTEFDIPPASALWYYGRQKQTQALFIGGSRFIDELKWKIPRKYNKESETYIAIKVGDASAVAGYIAKYMAKGETKQWSHRVKATKNLGLRGLKQVLGQLKCIPILEALATRPNTYQLLFQMQLSTSCPISLLRRISKTELEKRWHISVSELGESSLWKKWTKPRHNFYTRLIKLVQGGLRPWKMTPEQRYKAYTQILGEADSMAHCRPIIDDLIKWLDRILKPVISSVPYTRMQEKMA